MLNNVAILFDNPSGVFFPGQTVSGKIEIHCKKTEKCRSIRVIFKGLSHVQWTERRTRGTGKNRRSYTDVYRSDEVYYTTELLVWGTGAGITDLPQGLNIFPFSFVLPMNIPASFEGVFGYVRHVCAIKFDDARFWSFNTTATRPFTVVDLYDLNLDPIAKNPINLTHSKTLGFLFFKSGPISFTLNIDRTGFVPGEDIMINAECCNNSKKKVSKTAAKIFQTITFRAGGRTKIQTNEIASISRLEINPGGSDIWAGTPFKIPPINASCLKGCGIIDIQYKLQFLMDPSGLSMDLKVEIPIVIGTIPLQQTFNNFVSPSSASHQSSPNAPPPAIPFVPNLEMYPDLPLPTYEEATAGNSNMLNYNIEDGAAGLNQGWTPKHISYNMGQKS